MKMHPIRGEVSIPEIKISFKNKTDASKRPVITTPEAAYSVFRKIWNARTLELQEDVVVLALDTSSTLLGWVRLFSGGWDSTVIDHKLIFQVAYGSKAGKLILAHNHPSGKLEPSPQDILMTKKLIQVGEILEIEVADHLIVTKDSYVSIRKSRPKLWQGKGYYAEL